MDNAITREVLLARGYKKHRHHEAACDYSLYQRTVYQPGVHRGDKLYFITFYFWDFNLIRTFTVPPKPSVEANARLYLREGDTLVGGGGFDLNLHLEPTATLDQVEAFYQRAYEHLRCGPDWHNQG